MQEYRAARTAVGLRDLSRRGKIEVVGPDRISFLQAMLSNEVEQLEEGEGRYGTLLTATGKIVADFYYYRFDEFVLIDVSAELTEKLQESLESYVIMDDVELVDVSRKYAQLSLQGPRSRELLGQAFEADLPERELSLETFHYEGADVWVVRKGAPGREGFELLFPASHLEAVRQRLESEGRSLGLQQIGEEVSELLRLEQGRPLYGRDMSERNNPLEAGITTAYSLTKGCYPGQEVVARATNIGGVARRLARIQLEEVKEPPAEGAGVFDQEGRKIGHVTSAAFSPALDKVIGMALLKRKFTVPGMHHLVETPGGRTGCEVVENFA